MQTFRKIIALLISTFSFFVYTVTAYAVVWQASAIDLSSRQIRIYAESDSDTVKRATEYWNSLAGFPVAVVVNDPNQATVTYREVNDNQYGSSTLGMTTAYDFSFKGTKALIENIPDTHIGKNISMYDTAVHEIGHSLGLGHDIQISVMYAYGTPVNNSYAQRSRDYQSLKEDFAQRGIAIYNTEFEQAKAPEQAPAPDPTPSVANATNNNNEQPDPSARVATAPTSSTTSSEQNHNIKFITVRAGGLRPDYNGMIIVSAFAAVVPYQIITWYKKKNTGNESQPPKQVAIA